MNILMVFLGGGLGSLCRYGIAVLLKNQAQIFPYATFWANVISCLILGALAGLALKNGWSENLGLFLLTGFCGGFSTFSTFSLETFRLLENGDYSFAAYNIVGSVVLCLACIFIGVKLVQG